MSKKDFLLPDNLQACLIFIPFYCAKNVYCLLHLASKCPKNQQIICWNNEQKIHDFAQLVIFLRRQNYFEQNRLLHSVKDPNST